MGIDSFGHDSRIRFDAAALEEPVMAAKKTASKSGTAASTPAEQDAPSGADDKTRDAFRQALQAKNAKATERSGEEHLNGTGMTLHPNDKQQRTHRRKSG